MPFLRWSTVRMLFGIRRLTTEWQVGDGRELALAEHVEAEARRGDLDDVIRVIDDFAYHRSYLINVGDEKGEILDAAIRRTEPRRLLELGTYCGYSALRAARVMPEAARLVSIEFNADNAAIARRIWDHAGIGEELTVLFGTLGDGGETISRLESEHGFAAGSLDFVFIDHEKSVYVSDLQLILGQGWLHPGSVAVADNVKIPGAPEYREYMRAEEGKSWRTTEHETHVEYQSLLKDLVLESEYLGPPD
ncbi:MAG: catechol O-methyltransferase [Solirubrobacterales bacterium]|jgi:catechol O-methyltransferase|nr:catechol O-methyltransferase [Solirubrobacterales bacterium]